MQAVVTAPASHQINHAPLTKTQATRLRNYLNASAATEPPLSATPTVAELAAHPSVTAALLDALDVVPARLLAANASLEQLATLGYGAGHLLKSPAIAAQLVSKHGHTATAATVLRCPQDAVELSANSLVLKTLRISTRTLLEACAGDQASGVAVIHNLLYQHRAAQAAAEAANPPPPLPMPYPGGTTATANLELLQRKLQRDGGSGGPLVGVGCETLAKLGLGGRELKVPTVCSSLTCLPSSHPFCTPWTRSTLASRSTSCATFWERRWTGFKYWASLSDPARKNNHGTRLCV